MSPDPILDLHAQGFFQDFGQEGSKWDVMDYWGAKLYYIPESKAYDKLREPGISSIV